MTIVFNATSSPARIALYTGGDDNPMTDPLGNLSRTHYHSDLAYLPIVASLTNTFTTTLTVSGLETSHTIGAHGQSGFPLAFGYALGIGSGGTDLPMVGSIPVRFTSDANCIWWTLYVDATNVYIYETRSFPTMTVVTVTVQIYISSDLFE